MQYLVETGFTDTDFIDEAWQLLREDNRVVVSARESKLLMDLPGMQVKRHGNRLSFYRLGSSWWHEDGE